MCDAWKRESVDNLVNFDCHVAEEVVRTDNNIRRQFSLIGHKILSY